LRARRAATAWRSEQLETPFILEPVAEAGSETPAVVEPFFGSPAEVHEELSRNKKKPPCPHCGKSI